jgi:hypothetical protein
LATANLRSLALYRNGQKAGNIPRPTDLTATKISGLAVDTEYTFHLVLRTSAGTFSSEKLTVRTHKMTDLSGITVTPGIMASALRTSLLETMERIGATVADTVRIDTTHFVCTEPRGAAWDRAREMNIPIVVPDWIKGCEAEGRILGVRQYYLDADPRLRSVGPSVVTTHTPERPRTPPMTPSTKVTPPTPEQQMQGPVVPPKDLPMRNISGGSSTIREEVAAETAPEGKRVSADSVSSEEEEEEEDDASSEEEASIAKGARVSSDEEEIAAGKGKQAKAESVKDDEPSFQDVAL